MRRQRLNTGFVTWLYLAAFALWTIATKSGQITDTLQWIFLAFANIMGGLAVWSWKEWGLWI